ASSVAGMRTITILPHRVSCVLIRGLSSSRARLHRLPAVCTIQMDVLGDRLIHPGVWHASHPLPSKTLGIWDNSRRVMASNMGDVPGGGPIRTPATPMLHQTSIPATPLPHQ